MLIIADTSPLRYLLVIREQHILPAIFGQILIPVSVVAELSAPGTPELVRAFVQDRPAWLAVAEPTADAVTAIGESIAPGEREALALALELQAELVLMDDAAGRRAAQTLGIPTTGTIGVLRVAAERGLIDVAGVLNRLRASGFYVSERVIESAFQPWL